MATPLEVLKANKIANQQKLQSILQPQGGYGDRIGRGLVGLAGAFAGAFDDPDVKAYEEFQQVQPARQAAQERNSNVEQGGGAFGLSQSVGGQTLQENPQAVDRYLANQNQGLMANMSPDMQPAASNQQAMQEASFTSKGMMEMARKRFQSGDTEGANQAMAYAKALKPAVKEDFTLSAGQDRISGTDNSVLATNAKSTTEKASKLLAITEPDGKGGRKQVGIWDVISEARPTLNPNQSFQTIGTGEGGATTQIFTGDADNFKEANKFAYDRYEEANKEALTAERMNSSLDYMDNALEGINTGNLTGIQMGLAQFASNVGLEVPKNIANLEAAQGAAGKLVMSMLEGFTGAISEGERAFAIQRMPSLMNTPEGRKEMSAMLKKLNNRAIERRDMMSKYVEGSANLTASPDRNFYTEWGTYVKENPLFPKTENKKAPKSIEQIRKDGLEVGSSEEEIQQMIQMFFPSGE